MSPDSLRRRRRLGLAAVLATAVVMAGTITSALAFHVGTVAIELDGNTDADGAAPGVDWEDLFTATGADAPGADLLGTAGNELDRAFVKDFVIGASGPDASYHEPSNKDAQPINAAGGSGVWGCVSAKNPTDKDDILNTYVVAYAGEGEDDGDTIVSFGAERFDDSGTAYMGFWLFQADVTCNTTTGKFEGTKTDGDILMLANFSNGGSAVTLHAFSWHPGNPAGTAAGTFQDIGVGVRCDLTTDNDGGAGGGTAVDMCAITNGDTDPDDGVNDAQLVTVPWPTEDKDKPGPNDPVNTLEPPEFVEGSINITEAFRAAGATPPACFGSFMTETRSSDTLSATLKDFALGDLNTCDARVTITPNATNRVGESHTFTVDVDQNTGGGFGPAATGHATVTLTGSNGITADDLTVDTAASTCDDAGDNLDANGQCTLKVTSSKTGLVTANVSVDIDLGGGSHLVRDTDPATANVGAGPGGSGPAVKKYVDLQIDIAASGVNKRTQQHTFTVTVQADDSDAGTWAPVNGASVTASLTGIGSITGGTCQAGTTNASGQCTVIVDSNATGVATVNATTTVSVEGKSITVSTDGTGLNSGPVTKRWVDARISIGTSETNRVGEPHTFTVTVEEDDGLAANAAGGDAFTGWAPASGETVTATLAAGSVGSITGGTCTTTTTNISGQCTVTVNSLTDAGSATVNVSSTVSVGGISVAVDNTGGYNGPGATNSNVKAWVDLRIGITGTDTNGIGEPHTFTILVEQNDGSGWANLGGAQPNVILVDAAGASHVLDTSASTCDVSGDGFNGTGTASNGTCVVVFTSNTAGTVTGSASVSATVAGLLVSAATGDSTSETDETVVKTFVDGSLIWHKNDHHGVRLGGATFEVCRTHNLDTSTNPDTYVDVTDVCVSVLDNGAKDEDPADGEFLMSGLVLGTYTVRETAAPAGYHIDNPNAVNAGSMTLADPDLEITEPFVNSKAYRLIVITCDDITDELVTSTVTLGSDTFETLTPAQLAALGWLQDATTPLGAAEICGATPATIGATFGELDEGTYTPSVIIPK